MQENAGKFKKWRNIAPMHGRVEVFSSLFLI
jgi:hypothetical protein